MKKWMIIVAVLGLFLNSDSIFGFTLSVTSSNETCAGNGSITFIPSNTDPGGSISYLVYKLPNLTTPYATLNTTVLNGLSAGTYRIIATETVGSTSTTQQVDVTITDNIVPLVYTVQSLNQACSTTSNIVVNTTSGTGVSYEIFQGPMTFPLQASNTFSGLVVGVYKIRVFDACGTGVVSTFTVTVNPAGLTIGPPTFSNTTPPSCAFTVVTNIITPAAGTVIGYPLSIQYTVNPPGGGGPPVVSNTNMNSGNQTSQAISTTIPTYANLSYDYTITITDACGTNYSQNFVVNPDITLASSVIPTSCNENYFTLTTTNFTPPYTLNFTSFPAGFNPASFNASYPGPYNAGTTTFGSAANPAPFGTYNITITDACGRTATRTMTIFNLPPDPHATGTNNGCLTNSGQIVVFIPNYSIVTAIITAAPASYPFSLPHDVSSFVDANSTITLNPVPLGNYTIQLTDQCGDIILPVNVTVPVYVDQGLSSESRPGCDLNSGSVKVTSLNSKLTSVTITAAPAGFSQAIPYTGNANIATDGSFYMNGLAAGNYTFSCIDECNFTNTKTVAVDGYVITNSSFSLQQNCGSFNIPLNFVSNGTMGESYWLQEQIDVVADTWGHPGTGVVYVNGTVPNSTNSYQLSNNTNNLNLSFNGTFRIVRSFLSFNNGSEFNSGAVTSVDKSCIEYLSPTMTFNQSLEIIDINRMPCSSGTLDVIVTANGAGPLHYTLVLKDGNPFFFDNGNSNTFVNLAPGIYLLQVEDVCGNIVNRQFDVISLASLVTIYQPNDLLECKTIITGSEVFDLTTQTGTIMGSQSPTDYTLTYHTSLADAQNGTGAITNLTSYNPPINPQTIYARLIFNQLPSCYEVTSFDLIVGQTPKLNLNPNYINCSSAPVTVNASNGNLPTTTYLWSDGTTGPSITVSQIGATTVTVTATNTYGTTNQTCTNVKSITITISQPPVIDHIETVDWTDDENTITIFASDVTAFEYSLDGTTFQDENVFTNLTPGVYTVTIKDKLGCGVITKEVWLLNYPKFFTPNGDGVNETWYIKNQHFEPDFNVFIYDRYGKLMDNFQSNSVGWDGTYRGTQNVATDYWFVVHRQDGRVHRGHFALKR